MTIKRVFALGNGESRKEINLDKLRPHGITYGCNALYRDFIPDALVSVDPGIKEEIWETEYLLENKAYFKDWSADSPQGCHQYHKLGGEDSSKKVINSTDVIIGKFPDDAIRIGYSSGSTSVLVACIEEVPDEIYLIGHDLAASDLKISRRIPPVDIPSGRFNNVYKDSKNYAESHSGPTPTSNWISQLKRTFEDFGTVEFYMVSYKKREVEDWKSLVNIHYITFDEMWKRLNR